MIKIEDGFGEIHEVDEREIIDRTSAYGILIEDARLLLVQDRDSKCWEFPGGGLESGESKEEGMVREFLEETGINIDVSSVKFYKNYSGYFYSLLYTQAWNSHRYFYFVESVGGELMVEGNGDDTIAAKYFSKSEIKNIEIKPKIRKLIKEIFS